MVAVRDPNGSPVSAAAVVVKFLDAGFEDRTETDSTGTAKISDLRPGHYSVEVHQTGFRPALSGPFELRIDDKLRVDISLKVGQVNETVVASDAVPLLQTQSAAIGQVIGASDIANMPLLGRDFTDLMLLVPGVLHGDGGNNVNLSVNGQREFGNSIQLNGSEVTGNRNNDTNLRPSVDAMREFKVVTADYAAEFGRASGGVILLETKAGSNQLHGAVYEFFRPSSTAANSYAFSRSDVSHASQLKQHNFGATVGGPMRKGKDFFFLSYEGSQLRDALIYETTVPTLDQVSFLGDGSADLSRLTDPFTGNQIPIFDPYFFEANYYAQQYPGNIIPASVISPGGKKILTQMFPRPNNSNTFFNNYTVTQRVQSHGNTGDFRFDENPSSKDRLTITYDIAQYENRTGDPYAGSGTLEGAGGADSGDHYWLENQSIGASWSRVFSANLLNDLRASYLITPLEEHSLVDGSRLADQFGIGNSNLDGFPETWGFPQIQFETGAITGGSTWKPLSFRDKNLEIDDATSWTRNRHSLKFGYGYRRLNSHPDFSLFPTPYEYIGGAYAAMTSDPNYTYFDPAAYYGNGGSEIADLLLGLPYVVMQGLQLTKPHTMSNEQSFYLQDSWQTTNRLNLNYGVRYEYRQPYVEANNNASNFDRSSLDVLVSNRGSNSRSLVDSNRANLMPRLGAAYLIDKATVVRAGFGIFYSAENDAREDILTKNYPFFTQGEFVNSPYFFVYNLDSGSARSTSVNLPPGISSIDLTTVSGSGSETVYSEPKSFPDGYSEMYNLTVQRMLDSNTSFELGYVGAQSHKLSYSVGNYNVNDHLSDKIGKVQTLLPVGSNNYNSLQAKLIRHYANGWSVLAAYTYSHSIDNGPAPFDLKSNNAPQSPFDLDAEYATSDADVKHNFTMSNQLELPFGRGRRYLNSAGTLVGFLTGGWHLNSITSLHTGTPVNVVSNAGYADYPGLRPNLVPGQSANLTRDKRTVGRWFNTDAFADTPGQSNNDPIAGNAGRNLVRGPGYANVDFSLFKTFACTESKNLQFRVESFNLLNTPHFQNPNGSRSSGSFGAISSASGSRIMQFAIKFLY
ncbi:MAG: TonB-dependent receptor [Acidobacteria bacterium]|nr:TonB-dependent receptor [Acidobacteriota bacterium]